MRTIALLVLVASTGCAPALVESLAARAPVAGVPACDLPAAPRVLATGEAPPVRALVGSLALPEPVVVGAAEGATPPPPVAPHGPTAASVMESGAEALLTRAWLAGAATRTIDVQYFIFAADNVGLIATDTLLRAAERGVRVRVLVDDTLPHGNAELLASLDAHPGVEVRIYNPTINVGRSTGEKLRSLLTDFRGVNQRMHNKVFLVDGEAAITGGRNVANEYFDFNAVYNFRDRDVLLLGGAAAEVSESFEAFWGHPLAVPVARALRRTPRVAPEAVWTGLHRYACEPAHVVPEFREGVAGEPARLAARAAEGRLRWVDDVRYVSDAPGKNAERSSLAGGGLSTSALIALVREARRDITIQTPYLVTTALGQGLFAETVARGVRVRILTNSLAATDNVAAFAGYRKGRAALLAGGVELYEYRPDATIKQRLLSSPRRVRRHASFGLHAKSMVIDGETLVVGTFNLDPRSANLNTEGVAVLRSPELARGVLDLIEREMAPENAWRSSPGSVPDGAAPVGRRLGAWAAGLVPASLL